MTMLDSKTGSNQSDNQNSASSNVQEPPVDLNDSENFNDVDDLPF